MKTEPIVFKVEVHLFDTKTNQRRIYITNEYIFDEDGNWRDYIWCAGNYACDHNRVLFWNRAEPNSEQLDEDNENEFSCDTTRFLIEKIIDTRDGCVLYEEEI